MSFSGHLNPALNVGHALVERGHKVTLISHKYDAQKWIPLALSKGITPINMEDDLYLDLED